MLVAQMDIDNLLWKNYGFAIDTSATFHTEPMRALILFCVKNLSARS